MSYFGGKGAAGVAQALINVMPPHATFISGFAGHCAVLRLKRPAARNIAIDRDGDLAGFWQDHKHVEFRAGDALDELQRFAWTGRELVYLDPPYLFETRRDPRPRYRHELTDDDHERLLDLACRLPAMVVVSHYDAPLYRHRLASWSHHTVASKTRRGMATEHFWTNYPTPPTALHDARFVGRNYRERQTVKRRAERWRRRFLDMPQLERVAVLSALLSDDD
ncbi:DNA adenine methylase [Thalassobaculum sp.]|uniref:DNA adenine methylase n=1 Tax=Thalassobaculum sp. TaxID=2022740 RepID=UPI0032EB80D9